MNKNNWKKLSLSELKKQLEELRGQLFVMKFQIASGKFNKYAEVKKWKVKIAQILTLIKEKKNFKQR